MGITSTNFTSLGYEAEVTAGTTPATPAFDQLPTTGGSPQSNLTTAVSEVIRSDRMTDDLVLVDNEVSGSINYELSFDPFKPILESLLRKTVVTVTFSGQMVSVNTSSHFTTTDDFTSGTNLAIGQLVYIDSFVTNPTINGTYRVTSLASGVLGVYPAPPFDETVASGALIDSEVFVNGAEDMDTYTFCKRIEGITNTAYFYYRGCAISGINMNFETGSILSGSFDIFGRTEEATESEIASSTYPDSPAYTLMNAVSSVAEITLEGLATTAAFSTMNLNITNNTTAAKAIGTLGAVDVADFGFETTADIDMYFEDLIAYNKFIDSESFSVTFVVEDGDGNRIQVYMPKCKFETLEVPVDGKDNFLMLGGSFRALRDATLGYMIQMSFYTAP